MAGGIIFSGFCLYVFRYVCTSSHLSSRSILMNVIFQEKPRGNFFKCGKNELIKKLWIKVKVTVTSQSIFFSSITQEFIQQLWQSFTQFLLTQVMMPFYFQKVKGQLHCNVVIFSLKMIQHHKSPIEVKIVTIYHIWSHTEMATLSLGAHIETVVLFLLIFCAVKLKMYVERLCFRIF